VESLADAAAEAFAALDFCCRVVTGAGRCAGDDVCEVASSMAWSWFCMGLAVPLSLPLWDRISRFEISSSSSLMLRRPSRPPSSILPGSITERCCSRKSATRDPRDGGGVKLGER
jgi:hypothetical protein